jgi:predicted ATPase
MRVAREGLARAERTGERLNTAELHRLLAACHLAGGHGGRAAAEASLQAALADARAHGARMWELRAARDLARLWVERGDRQKAADLLVPVCARFTEGRNFPDLKEAVALADALG